MSDPMHGETSRESGCCAAELIVGESAIPALLDKLPFAAYICDPSGRLVYFNEHAVEIWGRRPDLSDPQERFCGSFRLLSPSGEALAHAESYMAQTLRDGAEFDGREVTIERPDGTTVTALAHISFLRNQAGERVGALNVLVDISDRKKAEETQARLAAIVESSEDAIISKTLDGCILSWNAAAERIFGYTAQEAIGQSIMLIIPPELEEEEQQILRRLRRGERVEHYETVRVRKDGHRLHISLTSSPICDRSGRVVGASKVARDITARKQADASLLALKDQLALQVSDLERLHEMSGRLATTLELQPILEETLRAAVSLEAADGGVVSLVDSASGKLQVRAARGLDEQTRARFESLPAGSRPCERAMFRHARVVIENVEQEHDLGASVEFAEATGLRAVHATPLVTRSGKVVGVLATFFCQPHRPSDREIHLVDLCARQAADSIENALLYAELRESDRRKDEFLATLAHELRNPLAPISNALQLLRLERELDPGIEQVRSMMETQVNHLVRLVDDLLEMARITQGKIELRRRPMDLREIVAAAVETNRAAIEAAGHHLATSMPAEPLIVDADPTRLSQVIDNLLNNAGKYMEEGGQIWLSVRRSGAEVVISVRDQGIGIPPLMLAHIFQMFAQVDGSLTRARGGLGIGLALTKGFVEMHGGRIEARSEGAGKGSEFLVHLPLSAREPAPARPAPSAAPLASRRILVIDDTRAAGHMLGRLLEKLGQKVRTVHDARAGLEIACRERPDIVISDIAMPLMDGYELARRLRRATGLEGLVLVALTGYGQQRDRQLAHAAGFDHHLVKPVSVDALRALLAALPVRNASPDLELPDRLATVTAAEAPLRGA